MRLRFPCLMAVLLACVATTANLAQQSTHFEIKRMTATCAGSTVASTNFDTTIVVGQESPGGAASHCNLGYRGSFGFWSLLGDLPVPMKLHVEKTAAEPTMTDLSWSGTESSFEVYRSATPHDVLDPSNLDVETSDCGTTDAAAGDEDLLFYKVIPGSAG